MPPNARGRNAFIISLYGILTTVVSQNIPIEIKVWDTGRTPLLHMVDVTNSFGLKVLAEHNFLNENNIAFSPYGLMGILVALYEGVDGESSYQVQRAMQLPWNRNVMRIGFRDIHRTLKTYFVPEEGFLAGLALNNENVTFNDEYKTILRYYGFDLDSNEQIPTLAPSNNTVVNSTLAPEATSATPNETSTVEKEENPSRESTQTDEGSTQNPNPETENGIDVRGSETTVGTSSESPSKPAPSSENPANTAEQQPSVLEETSTEPVTQMTPEAVPAETTSMMPNVEETTPLVASATDNVENDAEVTQTVTPDMTAEITATDSNASTQNVETDAPETNEIMTVPVDSSTVDASSSTNNESSLETLDRRKKSIVDFIFSHPPPPYVDDYLIYRAYEVPIPDPALRPIDENMFLVNGLTNVQVTYMQYDTVLDHAYLPHLEASALRLPLDSDRYYLLIVLPSRIGPAELDRLLGRMARESDLSDVYAALRPRRVRATVPSFTVKGHITLTTDLQKLGVREVFEPRQRDFTPMTRQPGVYVRSVEQAVSVAIRKYRPTDRKTNRYVNYQPVQFSATYPFLYFVMDSTIHVALMAGKMADPLNSRIL